MAAPMEVSLPQNCLLQKLLDLLKLESLMFCLKIHNHVIRHIRYQVTNQHESAALIGLFDTTSSVLPSVESYPNYWKLTQRGVQGYRTSPLCSGEYTTLCLFAAISYKGPFLSVSDKQIATPHFYYSCGLSTATIEYSSLSGCLCVCLSVCLSACVHDNSKNNGSIHLKLLHIVVY